MRFVDDSPPAGLVNHLAEGLPEEQHGHPPGTDRALPQRGVLELPWLQDEAASGGRRQQCSRTRPAVRPEDSQGTRSRLLAAQQPRPSSPSLALPQRLPGRRPGLGLCRSDAGALVDPPRYAHGWWDGLKQSKLPTELRPRKGDTYRAWFDRLGMRLTGQRLNTRQRNALSKFVGAKSTSRVDHGRMEWAGRPCRRPGPRTPRSSCPRSLSPRSTAGVPRDQHDPKTSNSPARSKSLTVLW